MKKTSKNVPPHKKKLWHPLLNFFLWPFTLTATEQLILDQKFYHVSKPEIVFNMMNIIYVALPMCAYTEKTTFSCKDDDCRALHTNLLFCKDYVSRSHTSVCLLVSS